MQLNRSIFYCIVLVCFITSSLMSMEQGSQRPSSYEIIAVKRSATPLQGSSYYEILGVAKNATQEDIKKAYYALAKEWHPDKWAKSSEVDRETAEKNFKDILEAYETLSDPEKRKEYDYLITPLEHVISMEEFVKLLAKIDSWFKEYPVKNYTDETAYSILGVSEQATPEEIEKKYESLSQTKKENKNITLAKELLTSVKSFYDAKLSGKRKKILGKDIKEWLALYPDETPSSVLGVNEGATEKEIEEKYQALREKEESQPIVKKLTLAKNILKYDKNKILFLKYRRIRRNEKIKQLLKNFNEAELLDKKIEILDELLQETKKFRFNDEPLDNTWHEVIQKELLKMDIVEALEATIKKYLDSAVSLEDLLNLRKLIKKAKKKEKKWGHFSSYINIGIDIGREEESKRRNLFNEFAEYEDKITKRLQELKQQPVSSHNVKELQQRLQELYSALIKLGRALSA